MAARVLADCTAVLQKISTLRATLGGGADQGIVSPAFTSGTYVRLLLLLSHATNLQDKRKAEVLSGFGNPRSET